MSMPARLRRFVRAPRLYVQSMAALAETAEICPPRSRGPLQVLVLHLFACLFASDDTEANASPVTLMVQVAAALGVPPFLIVLGLAPSYCGLSPFMVLRPYWTQVQDHCFFVMYSCAVVGIAALLKWQDFFPTLLDLRVLGMMPISKTRLFAGKVAAALMYLGVFFVGANLSTSILLPSIASQQLRQIVAHVLAMGLASCFTVTATLSLLSTATLLPGRMARLVGSLMQGAFIAFLFSLLFFSPLIAHLLQPLLIARLATFVWFPPFWFVGVYEFVWRGSAQYVLFAPLARTAWMATGASCITLGVLYPLAYRRRAQALVEGEARVRVGTYRLPAWSLRPLPRRLRLEPVAMGIFHFIGQTILRVLRCRVSLILAASSGVAIAAAIIGKLTLTTSPPYVQLLQIQPVTMATALLLPVVGSIYLCFSASLEPKAAWMFEMILGRNVEGVANGMRRWVLLSSLMLMVPTAMLLWAIAPALRLQWSVLGQELMLISGVCLLVSDALAASFRGIPFVPHRVRQQRQTATVLVGIFGIAPAALWTMGHVEAVVVGAWLRSALWVSCAGVISLMIRRRHHDVDGESVLHLEQEYVQRLGL